MFVMGRWVEEAIAMMSVGSLEEVGVEGGVWMGGIGEEWKEE